MPDRKTYPQQYLEEIKSVTKLEDILSKTEKVVPHINRGDREPGEDGYVVVLRENESVSLGRIVVQVKKLSEKNLDPPSKSMEVSGILHYLSEDAPFLIVGVDLTNDLAYWKHINNDYFQEEIESDQEYKTIHFNYEDEISYNDQGFVDSFRDIITENREIYNGDHIDEVASATAELLDSGYHTRAFRMLELEIQDAARCLLRYRGIDFGPYDKIRGILKVKGITDPHQDKTYRVISESSDDRINRFSDERCERIVENGLDLLEYLYEEQVTSA
ncbi:hypothetical protein C482_08863 [Natrialba chahannaoensis JCM 10990]|uniref:DUF4365 domain-containing protein n=1 Tax=Natrialba chahannaoensis JCM 10990 TaxID=1227492 RepID=M0AP35_9EURY|nr:DUF4365 domain-containing protein [Natrialba chahannaoensis]ELZ00300.1 hypothetical protein C482_08863 [Natrialba chahannaoensis JCM 10990]